MNWCFENILCSLFKFSIKINECIAQHGELSLTKIMHIGEEANISFLKCYKKLAHTYFTSEACQVLLQDGHKILRAAVKDNDSKLGNFRNQASNYYTI